MISSGMMSTLLRTMGRSLHSSDHSSPNNLVSNTHGLVGSGGQNSKSMGGAVTNNNDTNASNDTNNNTQVTGNTMSNQGHSSTKSVGFAGESATGVGTSRNTNEAGVTAAIGMTTPTAVSSSTQSNTSDSSQQNLANTKEKTPMCLINELARFNKVSHMYTLVDETGPAHKKTFFVKLKLGDEEYSASGPSIKKAQHAAASIGLETTAYKHPPAKSSPKKFNGDFQEGKSHWPANTITPTVELNALAMKRGEPAIYKPFEHRLPFYPPNPHAYDYRGYCNQRYHYPRMPRMCYVSLKVGHREFIGEGLTRQAARHNAAAKALRILHNEPLPNNDKKEALEEQNNEDKDQLKSEISLVHEIALKRTMPVHFEVTRESGPPHMKTFVTQCTVGDFLTEAEGNSKQVSKKRAAESMLEELKKLQPLPPTAARPKAKSTTSKKKNRNLIKVCYQDQLQQMQKADPNYGVGINPISRLIQIRQANKKKEPVYTLIAERGLPWRREFVMQVTVDEHTYTGVGPNKKLAKRNAAEGMLQLLGYSRPAPQPAKPAIKTGANSESSNCDKKVTFVDAEISPSTSGGQMNGAVNGRVGCQLVPGLLLVPEANLHSNKSAAHENSVISRPLSAANVTRPEHQLRELAGKHQIEVQFHNYAVQPEFGNKNAASDCYSRVSLSIDPTQVLYGTGPTLEASRDAAALQALKMLAEKGLSVVVSDIDKKMANADRSPLKLDGFEKLANPNPSLLLNEHQRSTSTK